MSYFYANSKLFLSSASALVNKTKWMKWMHQWSHDNSDTYCLRPGTKQYLAYPFHNREKSDQLWFISPQSRENTRNSPSATWQCVWRHYGSTYHKGSPISVTYPLDRKTSAVKTLGIEATWPWKKIDHFHLHVVRHQVMEIWTYVDNCSYLQTQPLRAE